MFGGRLHERPKRRVSQPKQSHSFVLKGQQMQVADEADANLAEPFSFCSCKCKCHQCSGELAESFNSQIQELQNSIDELKSQLHKALKQETSTEETNCVSKECQRLKKIVQQQEGIVKAHQNCPPLLDDLSNQVRKLSTTVKSLEDTMADDKIDHEEKVRTLKEKIKEMELDHEAELTTRRKELEEKHKLEMDFLKESHRREIATRDTKIELLKEKVSEAFNFNARERKEQIDELIREVKRSSNEAAVAQASLSELRIQRMKEKEQCTQCETLKKEVDFLQQSLHERDITIGDLDAVCSRMRNQLVFQGEINDLLLKSKDVH